MCGPYDSEIRFEKFLRAFELEASMCECEVRGARSLGGWRQGNARPIRGALDLEF